MKKQIFIIAILVVGISLVGCQTILGASEDNKEEVVNSTSEVSDISQYFPFLENTLLEYAGEGNEFAEQSMFFEFIEGSKAQLKVINPGTNIIRVLEIEEDTLSAVYLEGEFYHIENMMNSKPNKEEIILKGPIEIGTMWYTSDGYTKEITGVNTVIETPYKSFEALEVTTRFEDNRYQKDYYAKGIGYVGRIYIDGDYIVKTLLKDVKSTFLIHDIIVYYPLKEDMKSVFVNDKISFKTNDSIEEILEDKLKNPPSEELALSLPVGVKINNINLDRSKWVLKVDFSEELLIDLNAGSAFEYEILKSIVNTLAKFYDTDKVYISIGERPYESGHFALQEGEFFNLDIDGVEEFK